MGRNLKNIVIDLKGEKIKNKLVKNIGMLTCGVDEAGRGPLAGPVVTAAVVLDNRTRIDGIKDSKKLSPRKREELYKQIIHKAIWWDIAVIDVELIEKFNITGATMMGFQENLKKLKMENVEILVDGNYFKLPDMQNFKFSYKTIIHGDSLIYEISAASILAKVTRDRLMEEYHLKYPLYNFMRNKGYPTKEHIEAIKQFGVCEIHRKTFCQKYIS